jgi:hypothetical protein
VKAKTLRETIVKVASRKSYLATDELASYEKIGKEFSGHGTVNQCGAEHMYALVSYKLRGRVRLRGLSKQKARAFMGWRKRQ